VGTSFNTTQAVLTIDNTLSLVPDKWDELPLPKSIKVPLGLAVDYLPALLSNVVAAAAASDSLDKEIADFTKNNGWHKIDILLPLLYYHTYGVLPWYNRLERWVESLRQFVDSVKVSV
jgi:hypothetical protein